MLVQQELRTLNARSDLNLLLCRDSKEHFKTDHRINLPENLSETALREQVEKENPDLMRARSMTTVATQDLKSAKSAYYPSLSVNSGYSYNKSSSEVGILQSNRNRGMTVGLSLNYPLFDGFSKKRDVSIAKLNLESARLSEEKSVMEISARFSMIFREYDTNRMLMKFEAENLNLAARNFSIAQEKYRLGAINDIELRETQIKLLDAENRYLLAQYRSKLAETELLRLSGQLSFAAEQP
jgi:outer membrane protein TolC